MGESVNYTGRKIDLLIFQGAPGEGVGEKQLRLGWGGDDGGHVTTGIQKLCQSFALLFLTERDSVPSNDELGTYFVTSMRRGQILDEGDVASEFQAALELVRQTLDLEVEEYSLPTDEQLDSAELQNFVLDKGASILKLYVKITSVAGASRTLFLPVPIAIQ